MDKYRHDVERVLVLSFPVGAGRAASAPLMSEIGGLVTRPLALQQLPATQHAGSGPAVRHVVRVGRRRLPDALDRTVDRWLQMINGFVLALRRIVPAGADMGFRER